MANYRVGRVGIVPRGAYNATTTYEPLDLVEYNGGSYVNKSGCVSMDPTHTTYWQVSAEKGEIGVQGPKGDTGAMGSQGPKGDTGTVPVPLSMAQVTGLTDALAAKLDKAGGTVTGAIAITAITQATGKTTGALTVAGGLGVAGDVYANRVFGAVWNDYAERRLVDQADVKCGQVVCEVGDGTLAVSGERLQAVPYVVSDTYGFEIGKREKHTQPVAVAGRVLVYVEGRRQDYHVGDVVCASAEGKASKMTRVEIAQYPDRILGVVSTVPDYDTWADVVKVDGRVWIRV